MSLDLSTIKKWVIPEGEVQSVTINGVVVWKKPADTPTTQANHIKGTASAEFTAKLGDVTLTFPAGNFDVVYTGDALITTRTVLQNKTALLTIDSWTVSTSSVTDMAGMFQSCAALTSLDLSNFDTSKVGDISFMFAYCGKLASLALGSNFDTSKATTVNNVFASCSALTTITGCLKNLAVSVSLSASPLDHDSAVRIINGLATVTTAQTLTLSDTTKALLSATEKAVLINKGWTLA